MTGAAASPWSGFHRKDAADRLDLVRRHADLSDADVAALTAASALPDEMAGAFVENAVGSFPLPLGFAVHFVIDGKPVVVPMAVEESSVIAAASHGARIAAQGGGFTTDATEPVMIGQIEVRGVPDPHGAEAVVAANRDAWMEAGDALIPGMVERGGGLRDLVARVLDSTDGHVVVHLHVDTRDAMGANVVNTLCEALADPIADALGGTPGLRILSNLAAERRAVASCRIPVAAVGGMDVAQGMVAANDLARIDPYRAATHNKGIFNGIDPVLLATGNDWRAVEAGGHAWAARDGTYRGLTEYHLEDDHLTARLEMPLAVGTVGGVTRLHPVARACLNVLGSPDATRLARITVAVGLAQNLAALRALASEGIQQGHMRLHEANRRLRDQQDTSKK